MPGASPLRDTLRNADCTLCVLHKTAQSVCLIGDGPYPCSVMIVGEAPGFREDDINRPFAGRAGKLLDRILGECGVRRSAVFITNAVHCRPPKQRTPTVGEMQTCRQYLEAEFSAVKPRITIALGGPAVKSIMDDYSLVISRVRGKVLSSKFGPVVPTFHPAFALRRPYYTRIITQDIKRALELLESKVHGIEDTPPGEYHLAAPDNGSPQARAASIDIETNDVNDPFLPGGKIISAAATSRRGKAVFFPFPTLRSSFMKMLTQWPILIGHNLKFDLKFLIHDGCLSLSRLRQVKVFDTMIAFHLLDENYPNKSLSHLAPQWSAIPAKEHPRLMIQCTRAEVMAQNCWDVDAAYRLAVRFKKTLVEQSLIPLMELVEMPTLKTLVEVELNGLAISRPHLARLNQTLLKRILAIESHPKLRGINLNSADQVRTLLFQTLKLMPMGPRTPTGKPSVDEATLKELAKAQPHEVIEQILSHRMLSKLSSTFVRGVETRLDQHGRVHPTYVQSRSEIAERGGDSEGGTVTGRLSCKDPNFQQIPRRREDLPDELNPRQLFISRFPNGRLVRADYDQAEVRWFVQYSEDPVLLDVLKRGGDVHRHTAAILLNKAGGAVTRDERKWAKTVNFGVFYCISEHGLAAKCGIPLSQAHRWLMRYAAMFEVSHQWVERMKLRVVRDQQVRSVFGRVRRLYGASFDDSVGRELIRQGVNFVVQSAAADLTKVVMNRVHAKLVGEEMKACVVGNIHDAVVVDAPKHEVEGVKQLMREAFEHPELDGFGIKLIVPMKAKLTTGVNLLEED